MAEAGRDLGPMSADDLGESTATPTRAGYVALVGAPNAGKSTLLNRLVGERLSIVTAKAQTTWTRVTGIRTLGSVQMVFLDTPGLLEARDLLQRTMLAAAYRALREADVVLLLLDPTRPPHHRNRQAVLDALKEADGPVYAAVNKVDQADDALVGREVAWAEEHVGVPVHAISAWDGSGVDVLVRALEAEIPVAPFLYPEDELATESVRFFVSEMVREAIYERFDDEIPYSCFCRVEEFREGQDPIYIHVIVFVERPSQKRIVVGAKGAAIRALGSAARRKIEHFLQRPVYLDLWVKPLRSWRKDRRYLNHLGFRVPDGPDPARP